MIVPKLQTHMGADAEHVAAEELAEVMNEYQDQIYAFLVVMLRDRETALDCAQDTFLRAYQHLRKGKSLSRPWLYKVARNRAIDELHRRRRLETEPEVWEGCLTSSEGDMDRVSSVQRALAKLPAPDREILYLAEVDGFTSREIGQMLGIRSGAVRMRLSRAHKRFRDAYGADA